MSLDTKRNRPEGGPRGDSKTFGRVPDSVARDLARRAELTGHVVRVVATLRNGQTRVQHYTNLPAAIRATERADARGCAAVMSLCRVVPVPHVDLDELTAGGAQ